MDAETYTPPAGYVLVTSGKIQRNDLAWDAVKRAWMPSPDLLNYPVEDYIAVCRQPDGTPATNLN